MPAWSLKELSKTTCTEEKRLFPGIGSKVDPTSPIYVINCRGSMFVRPP